MLEHPRIPRYSPILAVTMRRVRTISREVLWRRRRYDPSETARQTGPDEARKIQSELHGDMQSQAEMTWPSRTADRTRE